MGVRGLKSRMEEMKNESHSFFLPKPQVFLKDIIWGKNLQAKDYQCLISFDRFSQLINKM